MESITQLQAAIAKTARPLQTLLEDFLHDCLLITSCMKGLGYRRSFRAWWSDVIMKAIDQKKLLLTDSEQQKVCEAKEHCTNLNSNLLRYLH